VQRDGLPDGLHLIFRNAVDGKESSAAPSYPDPRGEPDLRREIAAYLATARGIECSPSQIVVTGGFGSGLGLALRVLGLEGRKVWMEDPDRAAAKRAMDAMMTMRRIGIC
jgi:GntR family transcriptional regulator/MocR family aminotransferase